MISTYLARRSWLHALPAGLKLGALALISTALMPADDWRWMVIALAATLALYASAGRAALARLTLLRPLLPLLAIIGLLHGAAGNWLDGLVAVLRLVAMVLLANLVTMTTTMQALMDAVAPILRPFRVFGLDPRKLTLAVALVVRFVPVLLAAWEARAEAWRARTGRRPSPRLLVPFLAETLRLADHVGEALTARGFGAHPPRPVPSRHP
ncbi:MAG: CbiQ family ECF transporter T component [Alphaproteobacteria bacterium]